MDDKTTKKPMGMIKDVLLRIDKHVIATGFIILVMPHDDKLSIILGRPFFISA
jgi:hypothetical protein